MRVSRLERYRVLGKLRSRMWRAAWAGCLRLTKLAEGAPRASIFWLECCRVLHDRIGPASVHVRTGGNRIVNEVGPSSLRRWVRWRRRCGCSPGSAFEALAVARLGDAGERLGLRRYVERPIPAVRLPEGSLRWMGDAGALRPAAPWRVWGELEAALPASVEVPPRFVAKLYDAVIHPPANAVTTGNTVWAVSRDEQPIRAARLGYGTYAETFCPLTSESVIERHPGRKTWRARSAILIANRVRHNYFHWLFECVPRLLAADEAGIDPSVPILVPEWVRGPYFEVLETCNTLRRPLLKYRADRLVRVDELYVPSIGAVMPDDAKDALAATIDPVCIRALRRAVAFPHATLRTADKPRVVFANRSRRETARNVVNLDEVIGQLRRFGVEVFEPGRASFADQVSWFASADVIIGLAGSNLANLAFMRPGAMATVLTARTAPNPYLFGQICCAAGGHYQIVSCEPAPTEDLPPSHWPARVDCAAMMEALELALGETAKVSGSWEPRVI